jgi:RNA polymerase sigma-70 factor (ECF subfamily)
VFIFTIFSTIGKGSNPDTDKEILLMKRIKQKEEGALKELYGLYNQLLLGLILPIVKNKEEAEDVLQEVFVNIWQKAHTFDGTRGNVYSWLVTLSRNKAIDRIRSKDYKTQKKASKTVSDPSFILEGDKYDPLETSIFSERAEIVKKALEKIPEKQSTVIRIAYYQGMTQSEISEQLNIPLGTVKTRTRQGMIKLSSILETFIHPNE